MLRDKVKTCMAGGISPGDITSPLAAKLREACAPPTGDGFPFRKCWFYIDPLPRTSQGVKNQNRHISKQFITSSMITYFEKDFNSKTRILNLKFEVKGIKKGIFGKNLVFSNRKK